MFYNPNLCLSKLTFALCLFIICTVSAKNETVPTNQAKLGAASPEAATASKSKSGAIDRSMVTPRDTETPKSTGASPGLKPGHTINAYKGGRICTRAKDMKYEFTQCSKALTTNVFFYYPRELHCDTRVGRSEQLPPFMQDVSCVHECAAEKGLFSKVVLNEDGTTEIKCEECPKNSISVQGGFIYDPAMETSKAFPNKQHKYLKNFSTSCVTLNMTDTTVDFYQRLKSDCISWTPTGNSLIAQHPRLHRHPNDNEFVTYRMSYMDTWVTSNGYVQFEYRTSQK